jgi:hypothetical protein
MTIRVEQGRYVNLERLANGDLKVILTDEGRELCEDYQSQGEWPDLGDLVEDFLGNGWSWVRAEDIGALTGNDNLITDEYSMDDYGTIEFIGTVYAYEPYAIYLESEKLYEHGYIILTGYPHDEEANPTIECGYIENPNTGYTCGRRVYRAVATQGIGLLDDRFYCGEHARELGLD